MAALEAKEARDSPDFSYIRVYRHWAQRERAQPMRARIAARVTPSSSGSEPGLEMIEVGKGEALGKGGEEMVGGRSWSRGVV